MVLDIINYKIVKRIIDEWDPINVMHHAPDDEYEQEAEEITNCIEKTETQVELAETIHNICVNAFGEQIKYEDCLNVSKKIFDSLYFVEVISQSSPNLSEKIILHDAEINNVFCDYNNLKVRIPLIINKEGQKSKKACISADEVKNIDISMLEAWGKGIHIHEASVSLPEDSNILFSILLNSGDKINIIAKEFVYRENK